MRLLPFAAIVAATAILAIPTGLDSCAIPPPEPVFSTTRRPADVQGRFLKGKIGVIQGSYQRRYLVGAYRVLSGVPYSQDEAHAIYPPAQPPARPDAMESALAGWKRARGRVQGPPDTNLWNTYKNKSGAGIFYSYPNCLDAAFDTAAGTLDQRAAKWGIDSPQLREWVTAQDVVFSNCAEGEAKLPPAPAPDMDPLLAADRRYQIAAAHFYAGDWQEAREGFEQIAGDEASPWHGIAPYLAARAVLREATVENKPELLPEAAKRLEALVNDPARKEWHDASAHLLDYIRLRIDAFSRITELAATLTQPHKGADAGAAMDDFLFLFRRLTSADQRDDARLAATSDLADWLLVFDVGLPNGGRHALDRWRSTHSPAWLIAALAQADQQTDVTEAVRAAHEMAPDSPAFEACVYYGIAREISAGHTGEARRWADEALARDLLLSTRNLILGERLKLAHDWIEFLRDAPRRPEPKLQRYDEAEEDADKPPAPTGDAALFDRDAATILNRHVPLSLWVDATSNALLPAHLQLQIAQSGWVRAVLLGRDAEGRKLMERVASLQPESAAAARDYLAARDAAAARFAGVFLMLRTPGLDPFLWSGAGQVARLSEQNQSGAGQWGVSPACGWRGDFPHEPVPDAPFLSDGQRQQSEDEWARLSGAAPSGADYLAAQAVEWARGHSADPRVPEALHLAVQATRRGCRDEHTGEVSRQAYVLLHQRYPNSPWTEQTKYWYK